MHPSLLHQLAEDRVIDRRRSHPNQGRVVRRNLSRRHLTARLRVGVGGLLISTGHRLVGSRAGPGALARQPSTSA
jgi:hypothetical protein